MPFPESSSWRLNNRGIAWGEDTSALIRKPRKNENRSGCLPLYGVSWFSDSRRGTATLNLRGEHDITADVEVIPMQKVNEAWERLLKADVKYGFSLGERGQVVAVPSYSAARTVHTENCSGCIGGPTSSV